MNKMGRNDPCLCRSGKKYKKCYDAKSENCFLYMKEEHVTREKKVVDFLTRTSEEINFSIGKAEDGNPRIPQRARLALIFVLVDILGLYWDKYCGFSNIESVRFEKWLSEFCLIDGNEGYSQDKYMKQFTAQDLYKLRNSILHFYGVPRTSEGISYILVPDAYHLEKTRIQSSPDDFLTKLSSKLAPPNRIVQVEKFKKVVWSGSILMIHRIKDNLSTNPREHIDGIKRIFDEVEDQGVAIIDIEGRKK